VGLHARTAAQLYDGAARWEAVAQLVRHVKVPVLGNGDIWEAWDALRMMRTTGCAGVIVGRGCLGRPWLFRDLADVFAGKEPADPPRFGEIREIMLDHADRLVAWFGETGGMLMMRRYTTWYTKGFPQSAAVRGKLGQIRTCADLAAALATLPDEAPFPPSAVRVPRGKSSGTQRVALPDGFFDDLDSDASPCAEAEVADGG
jgi:tRNA-dihydrouridine synthase